MPDFENFEGFEKLDDVKETAPEVAGGKDAKKAVKRERVKMMQGMLKDTIQNDPTFATRACALSNSLEVVNTLGFGDKGSIEVDKTQPVGADGKRPLKNTAAIVGYRVKNIGEAPIQYKTEEYTKNEDGVWVGQLVEKTLNAGESVELTRKYMTILCAEPEISFKLSNGKMVRGSKSVKNGDQDAELEAYYFVFADSDSKVNDDAIKDRVDRKVKTETGYKYVVAEEYETTFGYLNNGKSAGRKAKIDKSKFDGQVMAANYVHRMLQDSGKM